MKCWKQGLSDDLMKNSMCCHCDKLMKKRLVRPEKFNWMMPLRWNDEKETSKAKKLNYIPPSWWIVENKSETKNQSVVYSDVDLSFAFTSERYVSFLRWIDENINWDQ